MEIIERVFMGGIGAAFFAGIAMVAGEPIGHVYGWSLIGFAAGSVVDYIIVFIHG